MLTIRYHSGIYTLHCEQLLPISIEKAWAFFSSPENLCEMTPPHMKFEITSGKPAPMYPGQIISYRLAPVPGISANWVTEITQVQHQHFFVDEQRFGPYSMWHHEHRFEQTAEGLLMTDKVSYKLPLGILGRLAHFIFVKAQLRHIFEFRRVALEKIIAKK